MRFPPFDHARFLGDAWTHGAPKHNLGSSGLHVAWADLPSPHIDDMNGLILHAATDLRHRLADRWGLSDKTLHVTAGTTGGNLAALLHAIRPGCNVVVERPTYLPVVNLAIGLGAHVKWVDRGVDWTLGADDVVAALDQDTAAVLLTSPNNPAGVAIDAETLQTIGDAAQAVDALVIVDQVYRELTDHPVAAAIHPACITTAGFNKCWGAPGIRVGWMAGDALADGTVGDIHLQATLAPSGHGQRMAHWLLDREAACRARLEAHMAATHEVARTWAEEGGHDLHIGLLTAWLRVGGDSEALARRLVADGILTIPGEYFGTPGHVRLGLGVDPHELGRSLDALGAALATQRS